MAVPTTLLTTTCNIHRPFGGSVVATGVACRLIPDLARGRGSDGAAGYLIWTHYLVVQNTVDIRDGQTRGAGADVLVYGDGDEVRIPDAAGTRYVVVWVEVVNPGQATEYKRAYLLRDTATWPGP